MKNKREQVLILGTDLGRGVVDSFITSPNEYGAFFASIQQNSDKNTMQSFAEGYIRDVRKSNSDPKHWMKGPLAEGIDWKDFKKYIKTFSYAMESGFWMEYLRRAKEVNATIEKVKKSAKK